MSSSATGVGMPICFLGAILLILTQKSSQKFGDVLGIMVKNIASFILLVVLCVSCGKHEYPSALVEADSLCYSNPKLALEKLAQIRKDLDTTNTADWMYFRLVKLKAQDKAYIPHSDLTNLNQMISYYEGEGDKKMLPEIYYLAGSTYFDLHDSPQALDYYHKVLDNITADDNLRLWGITHAQIGYVMFYQGNYAAAIDHYKISYKVDSLRNDVEGMIFDLRDLGYSYSSTEKLDSAIFYSHKALQLALKKKMPQMATSARSSLADIYLETHYQNVDSAGKYILPMFGDIRPENRSGIYCVAMKYYKLRNMPDSVNYYIEKLEKYGEVYAKCDAYRIKLEMMLEQKGKVGKLNVWRKFLNYSDSIEKITKTEAVSKCQSLYDYTQREKENVRLKSENERHKLLLVILGLCTCLVLIGFYVYYKNSKNAKIEQKRQMEELQHLLEKSASQGSTNKDALARMKETEIYSLLLNKMKVNQNITQAEWSELDQAINQYFVDFKLKLYRICNLSDLEYQICLLLKLEVSLSDISTLVHREPSALTMSRKRLFTKMFKKEGKAEELDSFIRSI